MVYLGRHKSGRWVVVNKTKATIPPFIDIKGPFSPLEARWLCAKTNHDLGYRYKLEQPGRLKYRLRRAGPDVDHEQ